MTPEPFSLTGHLARAARALVGTSSADTAAMAELTRRELRDYEKSRLPLNAEQRKALTIALEELGAHFIADGASGRGHGVQLKFGAEKTARVESWEGEGGLAADDDV